MKKTMQKTMKNVMGFVVLVWTMLASITLVQWYLYDLNMMEVFECFWDNILEYYNESAWASFQHFSETTELIIDAVFMAGFGIGVQKVTLLAIGFIVEEINVIKAKVALKRENFKRRASVKN